jgi:hypothetical protein
VAAFGNRGEEVVSLAVQANQVFLQFFAALVQFFVALFLLPLKGVIGLKVISRFMEDFYQFGDYAAFQ